MLTKNPLKLKDGSEAPAGSSLLWDRGRARVSWVEDGTQFVVKVSAAGAVAALGVEAPSLEQLKAWVFDSVCESVLGAQVEPDGFDAEGSPSWLLVFGMV